MFIIKEVETKKEAKIFTDLPNKLFKSIEAYTPALSIDELNVFNPKKNPIFEYCDAVRFIAFDEKNNAVGRIAGIINHKINNGNNNVEVRFSRFDTIDNIEVTKALFEAITIWAKTYNATKIIGPMGFTDLDRMGLLVDGFMEKNLFITIWNPPYYMQHLSELGFIKDVDWIEKQLYWPSEVPQRVIRASQAVQKRYNYKLLKLKNKKEIKKYAFQAFEVYNKAFMELYGFYPLSKKVQEYYIKQVMMIARLYFMWFVLDENDSVIAFGMMMPSLADANRKSGGKLLPFGIFRILKSLRKFDIVDLYFIAVDPKHQNRGIISLILEDAIKEGIKRKIKLAETGPELEENLKMINQWQTFNYRDHRRRRSYWKNI